MDAVRATWPEVPESADFVMYWWHIAAETVRAGQAKRFGFITTNSIKQTFNRRVLEAQLGAKQNPLALAFAIPDHPWVDAADGAAVRIAMTVGVQAPPPLAGEVGRGTLLTVTAERETGEDAHEVTLAEREGTIHADLTIGANVAGAVALWANANIASRGVQLIGAGFIVTPEDLPALSPSPQPSPARGEGAGRVPLLDASQLTAGSFLPSPLAGEGLGERGLNLSNHSVIRAYRNGRDLTDKPRGVLVIDLFGLTEDEVRRCHPAIYQWVLERVKPERDQNKRASYRNNWWIFGEPRREWRSMSAGLPRYIATVETAKHRLFQFLEADILPDNMLVNIAITDAYHLGVLSSRIHVAWALAVGGTLEDRPRYNKTRCFETFPFPDEDTGLSPELRQRIAELAEQIDAHRKRQQAAHPELTLTGLYNVLEKLRIGEPLSAKDKAIHEAGLVSVLKALHDDLDRAVFAAYGWDDLAALLIGRPGATTPLTDKAPEQAAAEEELLSRLVALNARRAAEEAQGKIRWLRPEYQNPAAAEPATTTSTPVQTEVDLGEDEATAKAAPTTGAKNWPKDLREQIQTVRDLLTNQPQPLEVLAAHFKRQPARAVEAVLHALQALGLASHGPAGWSTWQGSGEAAPP
ncbi:type IIL restriction-modification enzyme MmeI [Tepidimonas aquatica]|uniref:MmeI-like target recognition domain-containing protein n=1 Tax=Tepidimonas aquatica TaxID=247482 RepID=A0A554WW61_9BURK|nr:type IIL restriction-modification enzyme MmeI [Tepidimonas aquatica]TSE27808.1 hypothetical protein Taqua_00001 [Tepidimonas aquatica]